MRQAYLLDTSVLSLLVRGRPDATPAFLEWIALQDRTLHISTVSVLEAEQGIAKLFRMESHRKASETQAWLELVLLEFGPNILPVDVSVARTAGRMSDAAYANGNHPGVADTLIAATAATHDLLLLTRNVKHFKPLGHPFLDPLVALPD